MTQPERQRNHHLIDRDHSAQLDDVGAPGYDAVTIVDDDGNAHLSLALQSAINDPSVTCDVYCFDVPHEQLGTLPPQWQQRVALTPLRCGSTTQTGRPCRTIVGRPGAACGWHRRTKSTPQGRQAQT